MRCIAKALHCGALRSLAALVACLVLTGCGDSTPPSELKSALFSSATLIRSMRDNHRNIEAAQVLLASAEHDGPHDADGRQRENQLREQLTALQRQLEVTLLTYSHQIRSVGNRYKAIEIEGAVESLEHELPQQGVPSLAGFARHFAGDVAAYQLTHQVNPQALLSDVLR